MKRDKPLKLKYEQCDVCGHRAADVGRTVAWTLGHKGRFYLTWLKKGWICLWCRLGQVNHVEDDHNLDYMKCRDCGSANVQYEQRSLRGGDAN